MRLRETPAQNAPSPLARIADPRARKRLKQNVRAFLAYAKRKRLTREWEELKELGAFEDTQEGEEELL